MKQPLPTLYSAIFLGATALTPALTYADYQLEANGYYEFGDDDEVHGDTTLLSIDGNYFLKPVTTAGLLLGEAEFLNKSSSLGISYTEVETSWSFSGISGSSNIDFTGAYGRYVLQQDRDYIFAGGVLRGDFDNFHIAGGLYLDDHSEALLGFNSNDYFDSFYLSYKTLLQYQGTEAIMANAQIWETEGDIDLMGGADIYLNKRFSVGAETGIVFGDDTEVPLEVRSEYFFSENFAVNGSLGADDITDADLAISIGLKGRL